MKNDPVITIIEGIKGKKLPLYLRLSQVRIIRKNWNAGKPWWLCSPVYYLTRAEISRIVTMTEKELKSLIDK